MKRLIFAASVTLAVAGIASAEVIDFDDIAMSGTYGGARDEFNNLGIANTYRGYTWTAAGSSFGQGIWGVASNADGDFGTVGAHSGRQSGWTFNGPLSMTINFGVDKNVSNAWFNVFSAGQDWGSDAVKMIGRDSSNNIVGDTGFVAIDDVSSAPSWVNVVANFSNVRTLEIVGRQDDASWTGAGWLAMDDLTISAVPEPTSMIALAAGLAAVAARRKKK